MAAHTVDIKCETIFSKTAQFEVFHCCGELRSLYLPHLATHGAHLMHMFIVVIATFIVCAISQSMTHHQTELEEKAYGVVEGSPADTEVTLFEQFSQFDQGKMAWHAVHSIEDGVAFRVLR